MLKTSIAALAAASALALSAPASAAIITVTLAGTVSHGADQSGMFGPANSDLAGLAFTYEQIFDTSLGNLQLGTNTEYSQGGWLFGVTSPGDATLTIGGTSVSMTSLAAAELTAALTGYGNVWGKEVIIGDHLTTENDVAAQLLFPTPLRLQDGWHSDCPVEDSCYGSFAFSQYVFDENPGSPIPDGYLYSNVGQFDIATYDVSVTGAVPEPTTWAMMIAGFGLAGAALRRRRTLAA